MTNRRIHDLDDTATALDSGAYIAVDSDSYTAAKKFAADSLQTAVDIGGLTPTDGNFIVGNGSAWVAESGATARTSLGLGTMATEATTSYLAATGATTGATSQAQTFTNGIIGPTWKPASDSTTALQLQDSSGTAIMTIDTTNKRFKLAEGSRYFEIKPSGSTSYEVSASAYFLFNPGATGGIQFQKTSGIGSTFFYDGANVEVARYLATGNCLFSYNKGATIIGVDTISPGARLHVAQNSSTAAMPVAYFKQADVSEEIFEFETTVGTGNAIEAVGAKTLTTTHFVKCTITGVGTVYIPVGTIA